MRVWGKLEHVPRLPLDAALAVESGMLMLPALAQPSEDLAADLASVRQVTMPVAAVHPCHTLQPTCCPHRPWLPIPTVCVGCRRMRQRLPSWTS